MGWGGAGAPAAYLYMDFVGAKHLVLDVADVEARHYFVADRCGGNGERILGRMME